LAAVLAPNPSTGESVDDAEEISNALLVFQLDQLDKRVRGQDQLIGDLQQRIENLEVVMLSCPSWQIKLFVVLYSTEVDSF
jgi:hypothetical protein